MTGPRVGPRQRTTGAATAATAARSGARRLNCFEGASGRSAPARGRECGACPPPPAARTRRRRVAGPRAALRSGPGARAMAAQQHCAGRGARQRPRARGAALPQRGRHASPHPSVVAPCQRFGCGQHRRGPHAAPDLGRSAGSSVRACGRGPQAVLHRGRRRRGAPSRRGRSRRGRRWRGPVARGCRPARPMACERASAVRPHWRDGGGAAGRAARRLARAAARRLRPSQR